MEIQGVHSAAACQAPEKVQQAGQIPAEQVPEPEKARQPRYDEYIPGDAAPERERAGLTTADTGGVDRELQSLREKRDRLEQQLNAAANPVRAEQLERQLSQVEQELRQKDNDAYRRQHTVFS